MTSDSNPQDPVPVRRLSGNYQLLHRQYRLGNFEGNVGYRGKWRPSQSSEIEFYEMCDQHKTKKAGTLSFAAAIQDLYRFTLYLEEQRTNSLSESAVLLLRSKCLIYEATDYWLDVPTELGRYFINEHANKFPESTREVEKLAEDLNGGAYGSKDERARVIKLLLIAGLCGVNQLCRARNRNSYDQAAIALEKLNRFIQNELPYQHDERRESFGITGLSQYLTGQVCAKRGQISESRKAFRASTEAYVARLRQKEEFLRDKLITREQFEAKVAVTARRAALVAAVGDGQHYFVTGQLTRALESLTLARAALTHNSGLIYLIYVDMLYWSCLRSAKSSDLTTIEACVRGLKNCFNTFNNCVPGSQYLHRTGIELALALLYRAQLTGDATGSDYKAGLSYLNVAIKYAECPTELAPRNPSLLSRALIIKSRYLSLRYKKATRTHRKYKYLTKARHAAEEAHEKSYGMEMIRSHASATLGNVYIDLAELDLATSRGSFAHNFDSAFRVLQRALKEDNSQNVRNEAVCYLLLTRLSLLSPHTQVAAHEYFANWERVASNVEHDFCKTLAIELERQLGRPRVLVIRAEDSLNFNTWKKKLFEFLLKESLNEFVVIHFGQKYNDKELRKFLTNHLQDRLGYASVSALIEDNKLIEEVGKMMNQKPVDLIIRKKKRSYIRRDKR